MQDSFIARIKWHTQSSLGLPSSEPSGSGDGGKPVQIFTRIREKTREWHKLRRAGGKVQNLRAQYLAEQAKIQGTVSPPITISRPAMELQRLPPVPAELPGDNTDIYSRERLERSQSAHQHEAPGSRPVPVTDDSHPPRESGKFILVSDPVLDNAKGSGHQHRDTPHAQRNGTVEYERDLKILLDESCVPQPLIGPSHVVQDDIEILRLETRIQTIRRNCEQLTEIRTELEQQILVAKEFAFKLYCQTHEWECWSPILPDPVPLLQVLKGLQTTMLWLQARIQWYERKYPGLREQYNTHTGLQNKTSDVIVVMGCHSVHQTRLSSNADCGILIKKNIRDDQISYANSYLICSIFIVAVAPVRTEQPQSSTLMGKSSQYGVILDAGSSGTRVYIYKWKNHAKAAKDASAAELKSLPKIKLKENKKIHPGVSSFAEKPAQIGPDHLQQLIDIALDEVPDSKISETPVYLMATAGMRLLPKPQQSALLKSMCTYLQSNTNFILPDCDAHIQVISGETEGLYGWIAANYLLGGFDHPEEHDHGKNHHTYGFLDMGGASAQIAFAPNATESAKHADDLKMVRMRTLDGSPSEYKVFTATWLGFGANQARSRYVERLQEHYNTDSTHELPDPCMPNGLRTTLDGELVESKSDKTVLIGTGKFDECLTVTYPLLGKDKPCEDQPCLVNGQHVPGIDFDINHFVGVSEYWHTTHGVFGGKHKAYDLATYQNNVMEFCSRDWSDIEGDLDKRKKSPEKKAAEARLACFKASWLINMLYDGIGIPRVGLEGGAANDTIKDDGEKSFNDPFRPVDTIDGIELSWTLGKMVLYAAGQVPPSGSELPVGFGSNVDKGIAKDFEHAGSSPIAPHTGDEDDDDDLEDLLKKPGKSTGGLVAFVLIILLAAYLLRKPERRRKIFSMVSRRKRSGKPGRGSSLVHKLFGRNSGPSYERVLEEGDFSDFELGDVDSDEHDHSDSSSNGSRKGRTSGLATPSISAGRADELTRPPSAMDRAGLVVRTESRERLSPSLLSAGRKSRNGSPTRAKSPFMSPVRED
ncbi:Golgi apyrase [Fusarium oxysporum f. sp. cubense race 1]|uniref:Golgi apyrase n=3 Tax=Fusarium oxysporum TaxID=5507 RepID=N4UVD5_FUSC1|nr:Golgi apyrase [Fusarium oxysporum f. sp. cubense race 1]